MCSTALFVCCFFLDPFTIECHSQKPPVFFQYSPNHNSWISLFPPGLTRSSEPQTLPWHFSHIRWWIIMLKCCLFAVCIVSLSPMHMPRFVKTQDNTSRCFLLLDCWADFSKQPFLSTKSIYLQRMDRSTNPPSPHPPPLGILFFNMNSFVCHLRLGGLRHFVYHRMLVILGQGLHYLWCKLFKRSISVNLITHRQQQQQQQKKHIACQESTSVDAAVTVGSTLTKCVYLKNKA